MAELGPLMTVRGEIRTTENLTIAGKVEGLVWNDGRAVTVGPNATVTGDVVARDIAVLGTVCGTLIANGVVEIRETGRVTGRVVAARFILADGAVFTGTVQPEHVHAALDVARHRHAQRDIQGNSDLKLDPDLDTVGV